MFNTTLDRTFQLLRARSGFQVLAACLLAFFALAPFGNMIPVSAQDANPAPPPTAPPPGKALVYIYRVGRFTGSASHDHLYVNGLYLAYLKNSEYAGTEVAPGTVVVTGLPEMYTVDIFTAAASAVGDVNKKENERIRFAAEAGKTYYLKWTAGTMGTGIKVTQEDPAIGAKEMSKLHLSKPVEQPDDKTKPDDKNKGEAK